MFSYNRFILFVQVRYLDCLDFGRQNVSVSVPRISVWRGNMIKFYSELDRKKRNQFGKRQLRESFASGQTADVKYKITQSPVFQSFSPGFRMNVHSTFASNLRPEVCFFTLICVTLFSYYNLLSIFSSSYLFCFL